MKKILTAIAISVALPAIAHAQTAPAPAPEKGCCEKMKAEGKECCCKKEQHDKKTEAKPGGAHGGHAGH